MKNASLWAARAWSRLLVLAVALTIGFGPTDASHAQAVDPSGRSIAARALTSKVDATPEAIANAGGSIQLPMDVLLGMYGQSNNVNWSVLAGSRQLTVDDVPDDRIRILDTGKGAELIGNPDFDYLDAAGWTCQGCTLAVVDGKAVLTATSAGNPYMTYTVSGLTIGKTYELTGDIEPVTVNVQLRLGGLSETLGVRTTFSDFTGLGRTVAVRARFVATATSHTVTVVSNSGSTPTGQVFARADNLSLREVLSTGVSYPKAIPGVIGCDADPSNCAAIGIDATFHAAKRLLARGIAKRVVIMPIAVGGTGFQNGNWGAPSGTLYTIAKDKLTAALADNPFFVPAAIWVQGEADATALWTQDQYITEFKAMVEGLRTVSGAEYMPFIVGEMVPEYVNSVGTASRPLGSSGQHRRIDAAHRKLPNVVPGVTFVEMDFGYQKSGDPFHYSAAGARRLGYLMGQALWSRTLQTSSLNSPLEQASLTWSETLASWKAKGWIEDHAEELVAVE